MITTAVVKKGGLYISDFKDVSGLKAKTVRVDITILDQEETGPKKKKKKFNPSNFRGVICVKNLKREIKLMRGEWDRL